MTRRRGTTTTPAPPQPKHTCQCLRQNPSAMHNLDHGEVLNRRTTSLRRAECDRVRSVHKNAPEQPIA